jgi:hypothetical protein
MKELIDAWNQVDRNKIAALLSVVPGLGHLYKHHYLAGFGILLAGNIMMVFVALWLVFATGGLSLVVVPGLWFAGIAMSAFYAPDHHGKHPWLRVWRSHAARIQVVPEPRTAPITRN